MKTCPPFFNAIRLLEARSCQQGGDFVRTCPDFIGIRKKIAGVHRIPIAPFSVAQSCQIQRFDRANHVFAKLPCADWLIDTMDTFKESAAL